MTRTSGASWPAARTASWALKSRTYCAASALTASAILRVSRVDFAAKTHPAAPEHDVAANFSRINTVLLSSLPGAQVVRINVLPHRRRLRRPNEMILSPYLASGVISAGPQSDGRMSFPGGDTGLCTAINVPSIGPAQVLSMGSRRISTSLQAQEKRW